MPPFARITSPIEILSGFIAVEAFIFAMRPWQTEIRTEQTEPEHAILAGKNMRKLR
jgi:hypothetical protein